MHAGRRMHGSGPLYEAKAMQARCHQPIRGCSSDGRAPALQADCRRFDPGHFHQYQRLDLTVQRWFRARFWSGNAVPGQPSNLGVAQLVERVLWEHEAGGSRPSTETIFSTINSGARVSACPAESRRFDSGMVRHKTHFCSSAGSPALKA